MRLSTAGLFLSAAIPLHAQDFERYAPKTLENTQTLQPEEDPEPKPSQDALDETPLINALKGIVIRDLAREVVAAGVRASGVVPSKNSLTQTEEFRALLAPYLGKPVSMASLDRMSREVIRHFRQNHVPVVDVGVPEQDITNGVIQMVVVEGRFGEARAEGNRYFSDRVFVDQVRLEQGGRIDRESLLNDVSWMNTNPFRFVQPVFAPGGMDGQTDVILRVEDRFPLRVYAGYEDSGNDLTGDDRWLFGLNWGNAFGLDHQLNYQYTTSDDFSSVRAHSLSYIAPLPWRHMLQVFAGYTETEVDAFPFNLEGSSTQAGIRYTVPLPKIARYSHEAFTGFDWKQSDNSLIFGVIPVSATTTDVGQFLLGYRGGMPDSYGATTGEVRLFLSPGGIFSRQNRASYDAVRPGAKDDYQYATFQLGRVTRLPWDFTLTNDFTYQMSSGNLLPSEQMSFGGYNSIRGYDERELNNVDEGWMVRNELRAPGFSPSKWMGRPLDDELQFLGFWDYGMAWASSGNVTRLDGTQARKVHMSSAGPGLRYRLGNHFSARVDYGFQLSDNANSPVNGRWHIGILASF